ncbi:MAG: PAS domain-containing protein [Anaerolineae bacterium]|nr:PAS domain-containing protein [Anaerolineae bacterium]
MAQPGVTRQDPVSHDKLERQVAEQALLLRASEYLTSSLDITHTLPPVVELILLTGVGHSARLVLGGVGHEITVFAAGRLADSPMVLDEHILQFSAAPHDVLTLDPQELPDAVWQTTSREVPGRILVWPLHAVDRWPGVLWIATDSPAAPSADHLSLISRLVAQVSAALINVSRFDQLHKEYQRLQIALDDVADAVLIMDLQGNLVLVNRAAQTLLNINPSEVVNQPASIALRAYPELLDFLNSGENAMDYWEGPGQRVFSPHLRVVEDGENAVGSVLLILRDVTANVLLDRNQREIVDLMGHDIHTPLTVIKSATDMLGMAGDLNSRQAAMLDKVLSGVRQITALANNIEDAGRWDPQTGSYQMIRGPVNVAAIVSSIVADQQDIAAKQNIRLSTILPPAVPIISGDKLMIERALANLVSNAIKYTPDGGDVTVTITVTDNALTVCVSDTGLGIAKENLDRLFKRGSRIITPEITRKRIKGSGLGLFIVHSVAKYHNGRVWVESELGKGSKFYFSLPLKQEGALAGQ